MDSKVGDTASESGRWRVSMTDEVHKLRSVVKSV